MMALRASMGAGQRRVWPGFPAPAGLLTPVGAAESIRTCRNRLRNRYRPGRDGRCARQRVAWPLASQHAKDHVISRHSAEPPEHARAGSAVQQIRHRREMRMLRKRSKPVLGLSLLAAAGLALAACGSSASSGTSSSSGKITLTFWENYGTQLSLLNTAKNLIGAYEKLHPNVTIKMVSEPANNYFALLQASAISHTGPDLAVMWTGLYLPPYADILANVRPYMPASVLANIEEPQWGAQNFDASSAILAMPVDAQFYMGFYNKKDFSKAGIASPPTDWSQLSADCTKLKGIGVTP